MRAYVPGRSLESVQREHGLTNVVKLNQNENPLGPSPKALEAVRAILHDAHIYPEGPAPALRERLAALWDLPADWILAGNGSDEIFRLLAEVYLEPGDRVIVPAPSFAGYPLVAELMGAEVIRVPLADDAMDLLAMTRAAREMDARMLFLCRPNNPTGAVFSDRHFHAAMAAIPPDTLVVLDEAYREFDKTAFDSRGMATVYPNLVITRTFSKIYGLAGLRLGYGVMRPEVLEPLLRARDPFSINLPAVAAGLGALEDRDHRERTQRLVWNGKRALYRLFERLGIEYVPTEANFVLFTTAMPAADLYESLLHKGVLVRPCGSFGLPHSIRVTVGTEEQIESFSRALESVIGASV
jgi:histidinol-phosphate aminotransferase